MCESRQSDVFDAKDSTHFIQTTFVDFEKEFDKAPVGLKKRLVRNTFKQVVLAHDKLAMWFYLDSDDQERGGHGLKLVRDNASEVGVSLNSEANFGVSKLSNRGLDIGLYGDLTPT